MTASTSTPNPARGTRWSAPLRRVGAFAAIALIVVAGLLALFHRLQERQVRLAGTNSAFPSEVVASIGPGGKVCEMGRIPQHTGGIEVRLQGEPVVGGLRLSVLGADGRVLLRSGPDGRRAGWAHFDLPRVLDGTEGSGTCVQDVSLRPGVSFMGSRSLGAISIDGKVTTGAMSLAYVRPGRESLLAMIPVLVQRIGLMREVLEGPVRAILIVALLIVGMTLSLLALLGRVGRVGLVCAAVAVANSAAFSLLTPLFQIPDEVSHASYVQDLAVKHAAPKPTPGGSGFSPELTDVVAASYVGAINFNAFGRPVWDKEGERLALQPLSAHPSTRNQGSYANVVDYPPLYYATLVPAYAASHALGSSTLGAITPMRLTSALYAGLTVFALLALLGELFPGRARLVTAVALACAYQPVLVWISGGVNPDAALIALGATMFWLFARGFRRGLTTRLAVALTLIMVAAVLVQVRALGLVPGWGVGMLLLLWSAVPPGQRVRRLVAIAAAGLIPAAAYIALNVGVWGRPLIPGGISSVASGTGAKPPPNSGFASFLWEYVLPPIGSMTNFFGVPWTVKDLWVPMWVGKFGWYDYQFPNAVNRIALVFYALVALGALWALVPQLRRIRTVRFLALVYTLLFAGVVYAIARVAYPMRAAGNLIFEQARYVMPMIGFYALALALAASVFKRRAALVMSLFVIVCMVQLLAAMALTLHRYYL